MKLLNLTDLNMFTINSKNVSSVEFTELNFCFRVANEEELEIAVALVPLFIFVTDFVCGAFSVLLILFV